MRDEQLGFAPDGRVVLLDWGLATRGNPAEDLAWYLMHCAWRIRATRDELVEDFRALRDDPVALDLGLLCGLVMYGWILGHSAVVHPDPAERAWAREELEWWVPRARAGLECGPGRHPPAPDPEDARRPGCCPRSGRAARRPRRRPFPRTSSRSSTEPPLEFSSA